MVTTAAVAKPKCVLIVSDDPAVRVFARNSLVAESRYVFECKVADIGVMIRSFHVDVVVVIGERTSELVKQLRESFEGARIPARSIAVVSSAADARAVALEALGSG
jgi:hypothetical protein